MKPLLILLFITSIAFAQQDKTFPKTAQKPTERVSEMGSVRFTKTMNSLQFERYTAPKYKDKISRFMKTNQRNYRDLGIYTLHLVERKGELFILEQKFPEKLILLY
jgi:hypothetical protein